MVNHIRGWFGKDYWSFSSFLKTNTKQAVAFITKYEQHLISYARDEGYHGVICGHIHSACVQPHEDGFVYFNTGDWCETLSAVVENFDGTWELLVWNSSTRAMEPAGTWTCP
jgi:UDP-2,3-diacylglucosamine pyrophosphatase LpxH